MQADEAFGRHAAPADAGKLNTLPQPLAQRAHQRGAELVAGFLDRDQEDLGDAGRGGGHESGPSGGTPMTKTPALSATCGDAIRLGHDGAAGDDGDAGKARPGHAFHGARSDRRQVDAAVLRRLRRLHQHAAALPGPDAPHVAQLRQPLQHQVGAIRRLDRQHAIVGNHDRLTDVERAGRAKQRQSALDVGAVDCARLAAAQRALRHQDFGRHLMRAEHAETLLLEHLGDARQQMVVAALERPDDPRQHPQGEEIEPQVPNVRTHQAADHHDVAAAFRFGAAAGMAELAEPNPMVRKCAPRPADRPSRAGRAARRGGPGAAPRAQPRSASFRRRRPPPAGRRSNRGRGVGAHISSLAPAFSTAAIINGRGRLARMKSRIFPTTGSPANSVSAALARSANVPGPWNSSR